MLQVYRINDRAVVASYSYDSWGNILSATGDLADENPFRYRGYYYDSETGFYYLQSRYYDSEIGRFINLDVLLDTTNILGYNLYAYCGNNPISRKDTSGHAWETIWDIISLGTSIAEVVANPTDPWAWAGLAGDVADVAIPFVGGAGEAIKASKYIGNAVEAADTIHDASRAEEPIDDIAGTLMDLASGACFIAGTSILTSCGLVAIENIESEDYVWASNPETGEVALKRVVRTFINEAEELVHIEVHGEEIICTNEHPFYSPVKGWTEACELRAGDILVTVNGEYVIVENVQHEILESPIKVYNFEVEDFHTYYVSKNAVLVHNVCGKSNQIQNEIIDLTRVGSALKEDAHHAFSDIVDNYAGFATKNTISNGTLYQLAGSLNGVDGRFEWIVQNQEVTHRMFVKGGTLNGIPIVP